MNVLVGPPPRWVLGGQGPPPPSRRNALSAGAVAASLATKARFGRRTTTGGETTGPIRGTTGAVSGSGCGLRPQRWRGLTPPTSFLPPLREAGDRSAVTAKGRRHDRAHGAHFSGWLKTEGRSTESEAAGDGCVHAARGLPRRRSARAVHLASPTSRSPPTLQPPIREPPPADEPHVIRMSTFRYKEATTKYNFAIDGFPAFVDFESPTR